MHLLLLLPAVRSKTDDSPEPARRVLLLLLPLLLHVQSKGPGHGLRVGLCYALHRLPLPQRASDGRLQLQGESSGQSLHLTTKRCFRVVHPLRPAPAPPVVRRLQSQKAYIDEQARRRGLTNVTVVTSDINTFDAEKEKFDR